MPPTLSFTSYLSHRIEHVSEAPRAGGPVRVGLCRDSALLNSTQLGGFGGTEDKVLFAQISFLVFLYKHVQTHVLTYIPIR